MRSNGSRSTAHPEQVVDEVNHVADGAGSVRQGYGGLLQMQLEGLLQALLQPHLLPLYLRLQSRQLNLCRPGQSSR